MNVKLSTIFIIIAFVSACSDDDECPYPGSKQDLALYGVFPSQPSTIKVSGTELHIPADYPISLHWYSRKKVGAYSCPDHPGYASEFTFGLDLSKYINGSGPISPSHYAGRPALNTVWVVIAKENPERLIKTDPPLCSMPHVEYSGMRPYCFNEQISGWISTTDRTPKGQLVNVGTTGSWGSFKFDYKTVQVVGYYDRNKMMPYSALMYRSVLSTVESFSPLQTSDAQQGVQADVHEKP